MSSRVVPAASLSPIRPSFTSSTFVAFPNQPMMGVGRLIASLAVSIIMGWLWLRYRGELWWRVRATGVPGVVSGALWAAATPATVHSSQEARMAMRVINA